MLEIKEMSDEDNIFHFMNGLQNCTQSELWHQKVHTLATTSKIVYKPLEFKGEAKLGPSNNKG
jgi:hypothetical protein